MTTEAANANVHDYGHDYVVVVGNAFANEAEAVWEGTKTKGYALAAEAVVGDTQIQVGTTQAPESPEDKMAEQPHGTRASSSTT